MTSPAINGQKENGKSESTSAAAGASEESVNRLQQPPLDTVRSNSPLTAWWRVFKLANLLNQQGC